MFLSRLLLSAALSLSGLSATAHEFWIEPLRYQVPNGEKLQALFKNGQEFEGISLSFFDRTSARFEMQAGEETIPVTPRAGDNPALDVAAPLADGLVVVAHETTPSRLTYNEWEKFLAFAAHKDFPNAAADHAKAGWPLEKFRETYTRHAKALIAVGSGEGADREMGLATEFVAMTNPYAAGFDNQMRVQVLLEGEPRADAQVEVFERAPSREVTITLHRTDADGIATIPVSPGHEYLFDAVVLRPFDAQDPGDPVWETLWAALTFAVPF
ncbi:MAG: DUF4198 domain-containing protein [Sulfitobacter sp.]|nr:DUF4198 domain-containing protein [Sulfitobacter sp.]